MKRINAVWCKVTNSILVQMKRKRRCTNVFVVFMIDVNKIGGRWERVGEMKHRTRKNEAPKTSRYHKETLAISDGTRWINTKQGTA